MVKEDWEAYCEMELEDQWVYNKLELGRRLGHLCGPAGTDVPQPGNYIVKPIFNFQGMGRGAEVRYLNKSTDSLPPGTFWVERFQGDHVSIDFREGVVNKIVQGYPRSPDFTKFVKWRRIDALPNIKSWKYISHIINKYVEVNIETIGGHIIEVHNRPNPDFLGHFYQTLYPVYKGERLHTHFLSRPDGDRLGFNLLEEEC